MDFIAQATHPAVIPQSENIAIQVLIYVLVAVASAIGAGIKLFSSWFSGMREEIKAIPRTIIEENAKTREQYLIENTKKIDALSRLEMVLLKLFMKMDQEDAANDLIKKEVSR